MSYLFLFISLILIHEIPKVLSENTSSAGLGCSACSYYGSIDKKCKLKVVPANNLPKECTSFIMDGLVGASDMSISDPNNEEFQKYLKDLITSKKPVFLFFGHSVEDWGSVLRDDNVDEAVKDAKNLKTYLDKNCNGLSGIILKNIVLTRNGFYQTPNFTVNMKTYLETMKSTLSNVAIGLNMVGTFLLNACTDPTYCMLFSEIDKNIDFYVLNLINFNECTEELKCGPSPVTGDAPYTLEQFPKILNNLKIPKEKVHILYRGSPVYSGWDLCKTTYTQMCLNPPTNFTYCADTQQSFIDKGKFTKSNAAGFIIENIDLMDPNSVCECDRPFPGFYFILDGYNNVAKPPACPLFDSNCL